MKMLLSKCRLFIISLTFCYLLDSVFVNAANDVAGNKGIFSFFTGKKDAGKKGVFSFFTGKKDAANDVAAKEDAANDVAVLKDQKFTGNLVEDGKLVQSKMAEYNRAGTVTQEDTIIFHRYFLFLNKLDAGCNENVFAMYKNQSWEEYNALQDPKDLFIRQRILCQPIMIISGPRENEGGRSAGLSANIYNITTFPDNQGLYFEHHGPVKMSHYNWDLIAYVDLAEPGIKYQAIMSEYEATATSCEQMTQRFGNAELSNACEQFLQLFARATLPYLYEIEVSHRNMLLSIGNKDAETTRVRRGLARTVKQMANVLYGIYSNIDTDFIFNKIVALSQNRSQNITLNAERMRIVQVRTDNQIRKITQHQEKPEENLRYLKNQTKMMIQELDRIEIKTRLLEQALLFEILLNQYSYHTQNLMAIINSAMNGKLHTSMFTSERLLTELRQWIF